MNPALGLYDLVLNKVDVVSPDVTVRYRDDDSHRLIRKRTPDYLLIICDINQKSAADHQRRVRFLSPSTGVRFDIHAEVRGGFMGFTSFPRFLHEPDDATLVAAKLILS